jgi:hypothetical protein
MTLDEHHAIAELVQPLTSGINSLHVSIDPYDNSARAACGKDF